LTESLAQQTATSEILKVIASTPTDLTPVFDTICRSAVRLFSAYGGSIRRFDGELIHLAANTTPSLEAGERLARTYPRRPDRDHAADRSIVDGTIVHIPDTEEDPSEVTRRIACDFGYRQLLAVPMLREGQVVGAINVTGLTPGSYSERQVALLKTFADQAVIAIENVRLLTQLDSRNKDLTEALARQTATAELPRAISSSPTDIRAGCDTIGASAGRLCEAESAVGWRFEDGMAHFAAAYNVSPDTMESYRRRFPRPLRDTDYLGQIADGSVLNIADIESNVETSPTVIEIYRTRGVRSAVWVPMRRAGMTIGAI